VPEFVTVHETSIVAGSSIVCAGATTFEAAYPYFDDSEKRDALQRRYFRVTPVREGAAR